MSHHTPTANIVNPFFINRWGIYYFE